MSLFFCFCTSLTFASKEGMCGMKRETSPYEGNKSIIEDESTYEDYNTILLINLITEIVIRITMTQAEALQGQEISQQENHTSSI
jgi:hypothetical protein